MERQTSMFRASDSAALGYGGGSANGGSRRPSDVDRDLLATTGRLAGFPHRSNALGTDVTLTEFRNALSTAVVVLGVVKGTETDAVHPGSRCQFSGENRSCGADGGILY